jgi:hypothetical protein
MFVRGICEKYESKDEIFPTSNGEGNLVSRLVFSCEFAEFLIHVGVFA